MQRRSDADSDADSLFSTASSSDSFDEDEVNVRMAPNWCAHRHLIERRGFRLDTCRDVKLWYQQYWDSLSSQGHAVVRDLPGYTRACNIPDENDLCRDAGLPENLFRGTCCSDNRKVVIKAVHLRSRELDIVKYLSRPHLLKDSKNHLIPILDLIEVPREELAFIVMEEWSSQLISETPCSLRLFLGALRQATEHVVFMHSHHIAHLDISIRNLLTDFNHHYAYIDFECSRRFDGILNPRVRGCRGTELPPEIERGESSDPFKVDIWGLGMLFVRACAITGYELPEYAGLIRIMLSEPFEIRPAAVTVLHAFNSITCRISERRLRMGPPDKY